MEPLVVSRADACRLIGVKYTKLHSLLNEGRLDRCRIGSKTLITVESIKRLLADARVVGL